jgi:signal transduction histidine kinase
VAAAAVLASANGAGREAVAGVAALALSPALAGFVLLPRLGRPVVDAGLLAVWLLAGTGLVAGSGGAGSPLVAALAVAPALAVALRRRWAPEAGAAAVIGYAAAAALGVSQSGEAVAALGPFPEIMAVVSLGFAAGLMALGQAAPSNERALSRRVAEVSHELRTPLTHILGFSEMIERQVFGELSPRYVDYAGLIRRSGAHLLNLVNDLLDLSKIEAGRYDLNLEVFDVRGVIEEVVRFNSVAAEKKFIALGMVTPETALTARADASALRRMLINTLGNALKFTPEGGRVIVVARAENGVLVLETTDNGPGIPATERKQLGTEYERGSGGARAEGTGLGLSLVRALAKLHGGDLSFHEAPGGGALVRVTLPILVTA